VIPRTCPTEAIQAGISADLVQRILVFPMFSHKQLIKYLKFQVLNKGRKIIAFFCVICNFKSAKSAGKN
jgi:hypothetical protein